MGIVERQIPSRRIAVCFVSHPSPFSLEAGCFLALPVSLVGRSPTLPPQGGRALPHEGGGLRRRIRGEGYGYGGIPPPPAPPPRGGRTYCVGRNLCRPLQSVERDGCPPTPYPPPRGGRATDTTDTGGGLRRRRRGEGYGYGGIPPPPAPPPRGGRTHCVGRNLFRP